MNRRKYEITIISKVPSDLTQRISAIHAFSILQSKMENVPGSSVKEDEPPATKVTNNQLE